ncbi:integrin-linked kinase-associated serine/threonine phosphatase 2C-like isoform X2 [Liolophura sinensis]
MDLFDDLPEPSYGKDVGGKAEPNKLGAAKNMTLTNAEDVDNTCKSDGKRKLSEDDTQNKKKRVEHATYKLRGFVAEHQGERDEMQDAHVLIDDWTSRFISLDPSILQLSLYAVMDGHGGKRASRFASESLPLNLREKFPKGDTSRVMSDIKRCFIEAYKKTDEDFLKEAAKNKPAWKDGTTAISAVCVNDAVYVANLGDSKAVLCRYNEEEKRCVGIPLSQDHSPSAYEERLRIQKAGGHVKNGRVMGVLEVSRSIGDGQYKTFGVTCLPDVKKCQLKDKDRFLLIGCDGLWKSFSIQESIEFIEQQLNKCGDTAGRETDAKFQAACNKLVSEAVLRLSADNVTVILVRIQKTR